MVCRAQEFFGFGPLARRPEHGSAERVGAVEQDGQQQAMLDATQIEQRPPIVEAQPHGGEKSHTPRLRERQAAVRFIVHKPGTASAAAPRAAEPERTPPRQVKPRTKISRIVPSFPLLPPFFRSGSAREARAGTMTVFRYRLLS